ncbi:unnamed protein product [Meganyctiphanes norvegica]|uniref:Uncharacterized protein n=1 Tax=Meganyctiphanes norvegica TaxID=48144 RepID=A0AAV2SXB2_MEGNR
MDGVGGAIKSAIKDKIAYNPNSVIRNAEQILSYISEIPKISLGIYTNEDVDIISKQLPHPNNLEIKSNGIGISTVHEISYTKKDDNLINWKKLSSDSKYTIAKIMVKQTSKTKASPKKTLSTITNFFQSKNPKSVKNKLTFDGDKANADIKNVKNQLMITRKENTIVCIFMKTDFGDDY